MDENKKKKKFYIYVEGRPYEVDETVYRAYNRPIWKIRRRAQRAGECICPKEELKKCDGDCLVCDYYYPQKAVSSGTALRENQDGLVIDDTIADPLESPESLALERDLIEALHNAILQLDPESRELCMLLKHHSQRKAAKILGVSRVTVNQRWSKIRKQLEALLWDYFLL